MARQTIRPTQPADIHAYVEYTVSAASTEVTDVLAYVEYDGTAIAAPDPATVRTVLSAFAYVEYVQAGDGLRTADLLAYVEYEGGTDDNFVRLYGPAVQFL